MILSNAAFIKDFGPIDESCSCIVCRKYTRSYIRHLANLNELTALRLISYHNIYFYVNLMRDIRQAIEEDRYGQFQTEFFKTYGSQLQ